MKIVLIGSHPKGFNEPFHPATRSGKVLRNIVGDNLASYIFFDLWKDEDNQRLGNISEKTTANLEIYVHNGFQLIALGRVVEKALIRHKIPHQHLPHPTSRRKIDRDLLRATLKEA